MKRNSPFYAGVWPFFVVPALLLLIVLFFQWHSIEQNIADAAAATLKEKHGWAKIETFNRGRNILLVGDARSESSRDEALNIVSQVEGVRSVEFGGSIVPHPKSDPELKIEFLSNQTILSGSLGSQQQIDEIVATATRKYTGSKVVNQLTIGARNEPITPWSLIISASDKLADGGSISIVGDALSLKGIVESTQHRERIESQLRKEFAGTLVNHIVVVPPKLTCADIVNAALRSENINFDIAKSSIRPESNALIQKLAVAVNKCPMKNFEVSGHTDNIGSLEENLSLSKLRAEALIERLVSLGIARDRFVAKGIGPNAPIADNTSATGRAANRRIEFKVTN